jgi:hypothetical protein
MSTQADPTVLLTRITSEYATVELRLDDEQANGPRVLVRSLRDHQEIHLDPLALALLCHVDQNMLDLLADVARDSGARTEFADWMKTRHSRVQAADGGAA